MSKDTPRYVTDLARQMRRIHTAEEAMLWEEIRNRKLGVKFRDQHTLGRYIADFYCHERKLVIEVDGKIHERYDVKEYDKIRQIEIESRGLRILRIKNEDIRNNLPEVIQKIKEVLL